jgi:hypothetical protein
MSVSGPQRDSRSKAKVCGLLQLVIEGTQPPQITVRDRGLMSTQFHEELRGGTYDR